MDNKTIIELIEVTNKRIDLVFEGMASFQKALCEMNNHNA